MSSSGHGSCPEDVRELIFFSFLIMLMHASVSKTVKNSELTETFSLRSAAAAWMSLISFKDPNLFKICVKACCAYLVVVPVSCAMLG